MPPPMNKLPATAAGVVRRDWVTTNRATAEARMAATIDSKTVGQS